MLYYISGGARSGKSSYAMKLALELSDRPVYLATARKWDENFRTRIARHQSDRQDQWITVEEEKYLSRRDLGGKVVVVDCVTLWLTNFFVDLKNDEEKALDGFKTEFAKLLRQEATFIVVSNELGMGLHAETETGRKFTDLQGWANQFVAYKADKACLMVSGLPLQLK